MILTDAEEQQIKQLMYEATHYGNGQTDQIVEVPLNLLRALYYAHKELAGVAELVDAPDSKSGG